MKKIIIGLCALFIFIGITGCNSNAFIKDAIAIATDETGTFLINADQEKLYLEYDIVSEFSDIIIVRHNGKYGYINKEGKTLIKPQYQAAYPFSEEKAVVVSKGIYQMIDLNHKVLYTFESGITSNSYFSEGMLVVEQDGKFGYINDSFQLAIEFKFDSAAPFSESQAAVGKELDGTIRYSYIDPKGRLQIRGNDESAYCYYYASYFNNGYAKVSLDDEHYAFVDENHLVVVDSIRFTRFDIRTGQYENIVEKIDYAQSEVNILIDGDKEITYFIVAYTSDVGRKYFLMNPNSTIIYYHYFTKHRLGVIENNYLPINLNNGSYGIYQFTTNPIYDPSSILDDEKYPYYFRQIEIDSKDSYSRIPMGINDFRNGYASFYTFNGKYGLVNTEGKVVLEAKYNQIRY